MTTLKEYKAMVDGATDAPWVRNGQFIGTEEDNDNVLNGCHPVFHEAIANAKFIAASRNIAPDLIRVIDLAEEKLKLFTYYESHMELSIGDMCEIAQQALSEIRKLKGE